MSFTLYILFCTFCLFGLKFLSQASLALGAEINLTSFFDRKHYFYADLPAGYQITQHRKPVSQGGRLTFNVRNESLKKNYTKSSELVQIQIEQDSGKSLHDVADGNSLIDLNRCQGCIKFPITLKFKFGKLIKMGGKN